MKSPVNTAKDNTIPQVVQLELGEKSELIHSSHKEEEVKTNLAASLSCSLLPGQERIPKVGPLPNNKSVFSVGDTEI